jgi:multiple sugar transport system ATP-binding protein
VFLFDEPLSNLDAALRVKMRYEFAKLHEELKTTMIYVTHDQVEAMTLADRIVVLSAGRVEQVGSPLELYEHPCNLFVAGFIGSPKMNFIEGELAGIEGGHADVKLAGSAVTLRARVDASRAKVGDKVTVGVRPEHIRVGGPGNLLQSTVAFVESLGGVTFAYCPYPGVEEALTCQFEGRNGSDRLRSGDDLQLHLPPEALYLFDAQGLAFRRLAAPELAE